jgi:hypothetical protein
MTYARRDGLPPARLRRLRMAAIAAVPSAAGSAQSLRIALPASISEPTRFSSGASTSSIAEPSARVSARFAAIWRISALRLISSTAVYSPFRSASPTVRLTSCRSEPTGPARAKTSSSSRSAAS